MQRRGRLHPLERTAQSTLLLRYSLHLMLMMPFDELIKCTDTLEMLRFNRGASCHSQHPALYVRIGDRRQEPPASKGGGLKFATWKFCWSKVDIDWSISGILNAARECMTLGR